ncbi:MAG: hypothetical protein WAU91_01250 [Desulfatitalea sp.]
MPDTAAKPAALDALHSLWSAAWPKALEAWSKYTRLKNPTLCLSAKQARDEGLDGSFAMIRLQDQSVIISLPDVAAHGLQEYAVEVLAHEIGHHVLAPANLTDHARMIARMRWSLPTVEHHAPMLANLYTDLLINDRLQRSAQLRLADVYRRLVGQRSVGSVWALYMRIYEMLWGLERDALGSGPANDRIDGDALLGARLLRSYAREWLDGAGRFAALFLPHLLEDERSSEVIGRWSDTRNAGAGGTIDGLTGEAEDERQGAIHPAQDPDLNDDLEDKSTSGQSGAAEPAEVPQKTHTGGQAREPFQYGEILRAAGLVLTDHEVAVRYYRERARPHLIPFPRQKRQASTDPLPEGLEPWDIGHPLDEVDWMQSVIQSPAVIPGMTTVQRVWGTTEGRQARPEPIDLDIYVDSSGSMANPQQLVSYPALAGAIVCLSALRAGARVQATLWSGAHQFTATGGFVRDEEAILRVLTGYFGGATAFPIHRLRDTYASRRPDDRPVHILNISDDGISTMFDTDERGHSGWDVAAMAMAKARAGGTLVLNLPSNWERFGRTQEAYGAIVRARDEQGWQVHGVTSWEDLVAFAKAFSRMRYGEADAALATANARSLASWS